MYTNLVDSLSVTIFFITSVNSIINYSSSIILLSHYSVTNSFSSVYLSFQFTTFSINILSIFYSPSSCTDICPSFVHVSFSIPLYESSTFPANSSFLSIDLYPVYCFPFESVTSHSFLSDNPNHLPLYCQTVSLPVIYSVNYLL